jgi:hypothetical protein
MITVKTLFINEYYSKKYQEIRRLFCKGYYIYNRYKHVTKEIKKKTCKISEVWYCRSRYIIYILKTNS